MSDDDLTIAYQLGVEDMRQKLHKQADEIERLRAENEKLRKALKPFAELVDKPVNIYECKGVQLALIKFDDLSRLCRAAKVALESKNGRDRQF